MWSQCIFSFFFFFTPPLHPSACRLRWQVYIANSLRKLLFAWEADRVVHCLGDKNEDSGALQHSDLSLSLSLQLSLSRSASSCVEKTACYDWSRSKCLCAACCTSLQQLLIHLAFPLRPALVSRQMTQFDMPLGWFMWIMFPCDHHCRKRDYFLLWFLFFSFFF